MELAWISPDNWTRTKTCLPSHGTVIHRLSNGNNWQWNLIPHDVGYTGSFFYSFSALLALLYISVYLYLKLSHDLFLCVSLYLEELTCQFGCRPKWCRPKISTMWVDVILWVCVIDFSPPPPHLTHNYFLFGSLLTDLLNFWCHFLWPVMIISLGSEPVSGSRVPMYCVEWRCL